MIITGHEVGVWNLCHAQLSIWDPFVIHHKVCELQNEIMNRLAHDLYDDFLLVY